MLPSIGTMRLLISVDCGKTKFSSIQKETHELTIFSAEKNGQMMQSDMILHHMLTLGCLKHGE
jgi:hypothetical protein